MQKHAALCTLSEKRLNHTGRSPIHVPMCVYKDCSEFFVSMVRRNLALWIGLFYSFCYRAQYKTLVIRAMKKRRKMQIQESRRTTNILINGMMISRAIFRNASNVIPTSVVNSSLFAISTRENLFDFQFYFRAKHCCVDKYTSSIGLLRDTTPFP